MENANTWLIVAVVILTGYSFLSTAILMFTVGKYNNISNWEVAKDLFEKEKDRLLAEAKQEGRDKVVELLKEEFAPLGIKIVDGDKDKPKVVQEPPKVAKDGEEKKEDPIIHHRG
jgi:hypothetical protein